MGKIRDSQPRDWSLLLLHRAFKLQKWRKEVLSLFYFKYSLTTQPSDEQLLCLQNPVTGSGKVCSSPASLYQPFWPTSFTSLQNTLLISQQIWNREGSVGGNKMTQNPEFCPCVWILSLCRFVYQRVQGLSEKLSCHFLSSLSLKRAGSFRGWRGLNCRGFRNKEILFREL